ncbi:AGAP010355-PA-like protein [Anopheles sinensis]|uniref:AGAP010355-PA-like protein n=1 Tax=Anopheles sinensis TaxID=74873 RepID=A0A084WC84_ANOSI|nr:AGAP010355-PA-like protein [Anopheles sinensis]
MKEPFEIMPDQEHYSLRWNNHQNHILRAFDTLLQTKTLVDVTLVSAETSIRAHKVVLSACSPFFQRVFSETPCKHPVIVLKDFRGWVVQAIVDFMYRGEISVPQERLSVLIQAGESLQVRGLVDHPVAANTPTPAQSPEDFSLLDSSLISPTPPSPPSPNFRSNHQRSNVGQRHENSVLPATANLLSTSTPKLLMPPQVFADPSISLSNVDPCTSPMPRRKQARPRRRSGDCAPQDLSSKPSTPAPQSVHDDEDDDGDDEKDEDVDRELLDERPDDEDDIEELDDDDDDLKRILRRSQSVDEKLAAIASKEDLTQTASDSVKNMTSTTLSPSLIPVSDGPENLCTKNNSLSSTDATISANRCPEDRSEQQTRLSGGPNISTRGLLSLKDIRHLNRAALNRSLGSLSPPPSFSAFNSNLHTAMGFIHQHHHNDSKRVKLEDRDDERPLLHDDMEPPHFLDHMDLALGTHQHPLAHHLMQQHHHHLQNSSLQLRPPTADAGGTGNNTSSSSNNNSHHHPNHPHHHPQHVGGPKGSGSGGGPKDFLHSPTLNFPPFFNHSEGPPRPPHSPLPFPHMSSVSSLTLTPPHMFGLDSPLGLFPPGMDPGKIYSPLMEMSDPRSMHHDGPPFLKKKMNRPKGQHSAPRGGPPRSWTNAELTEALQHVWNKKMTTSQASRIFGIPYNSLLMYVRGKYGKSLKLEQLRKDCISGPPIELLQMGVGNNNNKDKKEAKDNELHHLHAASGAGQEGNSGQNCGNGGGGGGGGHSSSDLRGPRSASSEPELLSSPNPLFNPFPGGFYPDFPGGFPGLPLSMLNLLPPERHQPHSLPMGVEEDCKSDRSKQSMDDDFPQPLALNRPSSDQLTDSRREIYQQNGQD